MKNNLINLLINIALLYILIFIFIYSNEIKICILNSIDIWINNLIPSIFPFLLITSLLYNYGLIDILSKIFGKIIKKIYNLEEKGSYAIISSMFSGYPSGSKYTKELLIDKEIDIKSANHLITFTSYANPLFVILVIGETLLNNKKIGIYIFIIHLISGLLTGVLFKTKEEKKSIKKEREKNKRKFINVLISNINDTFKILFNMLGIMIFFRMIITIINKKIVNNYIKYIIEGLLEMTTGIIDISLSNITLKYKTAIIGFLISFGGLSIHFQTKSIIEGTGINYYKFLIARLIHSLLCFILIIIFYDLVLV